MWASSEFAIELTTVSAVRQHQQLGNGFHRPYPASRTALERQRRQLHGLRHGDIPVGAYNSSRLANLGIGHGAFDAGAGYTYFNPQTGHELSGVLGFTANFINPATQYQNGVDMRFDWGASQFLTKQVQVGLVGYAYKDIGCDSGSGNRVGCFQSQVLGVGLQIGYIFPIGGSRAMSI
jgi:hypothetical protein